MGLLSSVNTGLQGSFIGRRIRESAMESMGYDISFGGKNRGWLGWSGNKAAVYGGELKGTAFSRAASMGGRTIMSSMGLMFSLGMAYHGYKQGGVLGAAKSAGESVMTGALVRSAVSALGNPVTAILGVGAAAGYGAIALGEAGRQYERKMRNLEFGGDENMINTINSYGANTMRQRAATALNNSHINRRLALGNEAALFHSSYR